MKNLLTLHEAIVIALINIDKTTFAASFDEIANFIEKRNLFPDRKGGVDLGTQIMLRSTKAGGAYHYLFEQMDDSTISLRGSSAVALIKSRNKAMSALGKDLADYTNSKTSESKAEKRKQT